MPAQTLITTTFYEMVVVALMDNIEITVSNIKKYQVL
jgi:hypothetical protein